MMLSQIKFAAQQTARRNLELDEVSAIGAATRNQCNGACTGHVTHREPSIVSRCRDDARHSALDLSRLEREFNPLAAYGDAGGGSAIARIAHDAKDQCAGISLLRLPAYRGANPRRRWNGKIGLDRPVIVDTYSLEWCFDSE